MALLHGIKERLHLPLYDALLVRPKQQLWAVESSSVLRFFVNVQGKTKLQTNMQAASLLPHWNTFETRALRVVVSDLPAVLPDEVERCIREASGTAEGQALASLSACLADLLRLLHEKRQGLAENPLSRVRSCVSEFHDLAAKADEVSEDLERCHGLFTALCDPHTLEPMLQLRSELASVRTDLADVIRRTRIPFTKPDAVHRVVAKIERLGDIEEATALPDRIKNVPACLDAFRQSIALIKQLKRSDANQAAACVNAIERLIQSEMSEVEKLERLKGCLSDVRAQLERLRPALRSARDEAIRKCLNERLVDKRMVPIDEQLFGNGSRILAKLVYNSVTTFSVGEKIMIQMPTWFFPSGAGPYSEDGNVVTHGFPAPEATFRFAEPVFVDTRQNFRVEIEIPEAGQLDTIQRIYGPFFIWVVLDGYMVRDVQ